MKFSDTKTSQGNIEDEGIDISEIKQTIIRNKKLVSLFVLGGFFFGLLYAFTREEIWRGQFQIVLSNASSSTSSRNEIARNLSSRAKLSFDREKINTQVEILKSPSVLRPIYEKLKLDKRRRGERLANLRYFKWRDKSILIKRKKDTYVLDVYYKDSNKDRVLPTLVDISSTYQNFVNEGIKKKASSKIKFLEEQIKIYKKKSDQSFKKAQDFAFENDIAILNNSGRGDDEIVSVPDLSDEVLIDTATSIREIDSQFNQYSEALDSSTSLQEKYLITNVEDIRIKSGKKIDKLNQKINNIESIDDEIEKESVLKSIIPDSNILISLDKLDIEIANKENIYKKSDKTIKNLYRLRSNLIKQLESKALRELKANLNIEKSKFESAVRPKGVITKYKDLARESEFDLKVFLITQKNLRNLKLRLNSSSYPWEIITKPIIGDYALYPQKRKIILLFMFIGLVIGIVTSLVKEKQKRIIYSKEDFLNLFGNNILFLDSILPESEKESLIKLYAESVISKEKINCIIPIGPIPYEEVEKIKSKIIKYCSNDLIIKSEINEILENDNILLISKIGNVSENDLSLFNNKISIKGIKVNWALLI